ncbi:MAG: Sua5/YciO/YrdC/YwlC family protein, partial [Alphaproteobacteria bacterium]|nr:Sua5/YciO/YrdC/YwlC family protein [Alphaproteobacteria bacterium]
MIDNNEIKKACSLLEQGNLVGMPTETVYGLAGDATNPKAIAAIYALKGRPTFNPLIIHTYALEKIAGWVVMNDSAQALAQHFWPGPLTLVLP